jgi:hypothetical protein
MFEERQRIVHWLAFGERDDPAAQWRRIACFDLFDLVATENEREWEWLNER